LEDGGYKVGQYKKILISIPDNLLREVDNIVSNEKTNRSMLVREAMDFYIKEKHKIELRERMKSGYEEMAEINLGLAEDYLSADNDQQCRYEERLGEMEETW
jgi:CopG family transcriptional regulator/antitoxin EndoAI